MNRLSLSAIALVIASPVYAGGTVAPAPIVIVEPIVEETWTGWSGGLSYNHIASASVGGIDLSGYGLVISGGYRYDFGNWVVGGAVDASVAGEVEDNAGTTDDFGTNRFLGEVGYDLGRALVYGTVGVADVTLGTGNDLATVYGIGVDYMINDNITVGAEVLQHTASDFDGVPGVDADILTVGINAAYRF
jgi:opacity protein-like surface antigen